MRILIVALLLVGAFVWRAPGHPCECCNQSLSLGQVVIEGSPHNKVPDGYESVPFSLSNTGLQNDLKGWLAVGEPPQGVETVSVLVAMTESGGTSYWTDQNTEMHQQCEVLRSEGWLVVQVRWWGWWWRAEDGEDAGIAKLAVRPATIVHWIHETYCAPSGLPLTLIGQSGGAAQAAYCLSHYGLEDILSRVIMTGGPPMAAMQKSLDDVPGEEAYSMNEGKLNNWDEAYGIFTGDGPAKTHDADYLINGVRAGDRWGADAIDTGALDIDHPATDLWFLIGNSDGRMQAIGGDYHALLAAVPSNNLTWQIIPGTGHKVYSTGAGRDAIYQAITE